jgi:hypothetical protein
MYFKMICLIYLFMLFMIEMIICYGYISEKTL